jgi:hypothetical protein
VPKKPTIRGGRNIAMKVPAHQFDATIESYSQMGIPILERSPRNVTFEFGPMHLHIDKVANLSHAEIWLEFIVSDAKAAAEYVEQTTSFVRCEGIEPLPTDYPGFWIASPSSIVHLVTENE